MTNEEREKKTKIANMLIGTIKDLRTPMLMYQVEKDVAKEALENYIKALEQQPCEDCISRQDTLNAIETWDKFGVNAEQKLIRWKDHYVPYVHLDDVRNAIANMPSVTPKAESEEEE